MANWDGGQLSTITAGTTLSCTALRQGQIYGILLYNAANNDQNATLQVVTANSTMPVTVTVPGTTGNQGLATVVLVSGTDSSSVSVSMASNAGTAQVQAWIGSVGMPTNTTGINNQQLPLTGVPQPFLKYARYFNVPPSKWCALTLNSPNITQFISLQFQENYATVYILNPTVTPAASVVPIGPSVILGAPGKGTYSIVTPNGVPQTISVNVQGNGTQWVWMNADSPQDSQSASISLQPLSSEMFIVKDFAEHSKTHKQSQAQL